LYSYVSTNINAAAIRIRHPATHGPINLDASKVTGLTNKLKFTAFEDDSEEKNTTSIILSCFNAGDKKPRNDGDEQ
jgi:hypothetical protein